MTFKDVVIKNFKFNFKAYSSYFICSTFTINLFFIFATLLYNKTVAAFLRDAGSGADMVMNIALISTIIFGIFFISYVHTSMKKSRSKEFGLLMTLGMTAKDIGKIVVIEDVILSLVSLFSGILVGTLFSKLVHMLINRIMDLQVAYSLSYKSFVLTFCTFFIIFTLVIFGGWIKTRNLNISKLLKEQRKTEYTGDGSLAAIISGVIMIIYLIVIAIWAINDRDIALNNSLTLSAIIFGLIGVYLLIVNLFPRLLCFIKKRKSFYNKNMIMLGEIKYSIGKNKKLMYMCVILCMFIIYSFTSTIGLYSIIDNIVDTSNGQDIEYIEASNINNFSKKQIDSLIIEEKLSLKSNEEIKCLFLSVNGMTLDYKLPVVAISESSFNKLSQEKTDVPKGSVRLTGDVLNLPKVNANSINVAVGNSTKKLSILQPEKLPVLSLGTYLQYKFTIILNDENYKELEAFSPQIMVGTINKFKFSNWRNTKGLFTKLTELSKAEKNITGKSSMREAFNISGKYYGYEAMKKLYSIFIFIFVFLALLFYVASVLMLFLRQFEALERTKIKYNQLRKIGITKKEFGKNILGESRIIFLTPVFFGVILAYSIMLITESVVGGSSLVKVFMKNAVILTAFYIVLQFIACEWSGRKFLNKVMEE